MYWFHTKHNTNTMHKDPDSGMIVPKPVAVSILMDELDIEIEYDRLEYEVFVQEKVRKVARAMARERDLLYDKERRT